MNKKTFPLPDIQAPRKAVPGPLGNMELTLPQGVGVLRFSAWKGLEGVNHAFTTRVGGVSENEFAAMNLGFGRGDEPERVEENYRLFCAAAGFDPDSLVCGAQDHHINIRRVEKAQRGIGIWREKDMESIDGLCTNDPASPWSSTAPTACPCTSTTRSTGPSAWLTRLAGHRYGHGESMVERMAQEFGTRPEALRVGIGPPSARTASRWTSPWPRSL